MFFVEDWGYSLKEDTGADMYCHYTQTEIASGEVSE